LPKSFVKQGAPLFLPFSHTIDVPDPFDKWVVLMERFQLQRSYTDIKLLQIQD
jgi:hypothetical protein